MSALEKFKINSPDFNRDNKIDEKDIDILLPLLQLFGPDEVLEMTTKTKQDLEDLDTLVNINLSNIDELEPDIIYLGSKIKEKKYKLENAEKQEYKQILETLYNGLTPDKKQLYQEFMQDYNNSQEVSNVLITVLGIDDNPRGYLELWDFLRKFGKDKKDFEKTYNQMLDIYYYDNLRLLQDIAQVYIGNLGFDNLLQH